MNAMLIQCLLAIISYECIQNGHCHAAQRGIFDAIDEMLKSPKRSSIARHEQHDSLADASTVHPFASYSALIPGYRRRTERSKSPIQWLACTMLTFLNHSFQPWRPRDDV